MRSNRRSGLSPSHAFCAFFTLLTTLALGCGDDTGSGGSGQGASGQGGSGAGNQGGAGQGGSGASAQGGAGQGGGIAEGCGDGDIDPGEQCDDANNAGGDGCEADCRKPGPEIVACAELAPLASGTCAVVAGDGKKLLSGDVLVPGTVYVGGQVLVDAQGTITCTGCDCSAQAAGATTITCPGAAISPSLINAHDHITFIQNDPYSDTGERYEHRHDWRKGNNGHTSIPASGGASSDQMSWGELRFVLGGATSTIGSGSVDGLLRNLDKTAQEGLGQPAALYDTFPLGDTGGLELSMGCDYPSFTTSTEIAGEDAYFPHVAEGIEASARNELLCVSGSANGGQDLMEAQSAFIHSVGLLASDYALMSAAGTSLVWSPRSNVTLYGDTAVVTAASRLGVRIALGTDWMPTGSMNVLRELACADGLNSTYYDRFFTDEELWLMVTANAAKASATDDVLGTLASGKVADIAIFAGGAAKYHRAVIEAKPEDVALVMRGGTILYGDDAIVATVPSTGSCDALDVCGTAKRACVQGEIGKSLSALESANQGRYALFHCDAPPSEPSCTPSRTPVGNLPNPSVNGSTLYDGVATATDKDGDGIEDADDNCPSVFNPIRPLDGGVQADFDADGAGDACDVCPIDANTHVCSTIDASDLDGDGVPNDTDNCPDASNPTQADGDNDDKGDACDACPMAANPGAAACPATIYDVKTGVVALGSEVAISGALVTAQRASGFFLQVGENDPDYAGPEDSGVFVYAPGNTVAQGDRVDVVSATVSDFFGQIQLAQVTVAVTAQNQTLPAAVVVQPSAIATNGAQAAALEGVLVQVEDVQVTNLDPAPGPGQATPNDEFEVESTLRVNNFFYTLAPYPAVGDTLAVVRGVLRLANANTKIEPRDASDAIFGSATLTTFGTADSFVRVGTSNGNTIPEPLTVTLSSPLAMDTFVSVTSSNPAALSVTGGGVTIPAGQLGANVLVSGLAQNASVTLTASYSGAQLQRAVRVLGANEAPTAVTLEPATATIAALGTANLTVKLDVPAPSGGTTVSLASSPSGAAMVPATVSIPANALSATVTVTDLGAQASYSISATLGGSSDSTAFTVVSGGGLVLNEVDYDNVGTDGAEYIELYNPTTNAIDLTSYELLLVNGSNDAVYTTFPLDLMGPLGAGQYVVVGSTAVAAANGSAKIDFVGSQTDRIQNGAPDAIAVIDTATMTLVDALSYEGDIGTVMLSIGMADLLEGVATVSASDSNTVEGSLCRLPNGVDTDVASTDWKACSRTPGAVNAP